MDLNMVILEVDGTLANPVVRVAVGVHRVDIGERRWRGPYKEI
jgi:hypothetical protein